MPNWAAGWSPVSAVSWYDTGAGTALDAGGAVIAATPNAPPAPITAARMNRMMMPRGRAITSNRSLARVDADLGLAGEALGRSPIDIGTRREVRERVEGRLPVDGDRERGNECSALLKDRLHLPGERLARSEVRGLPVQHDLEPAAVPAAVVRVRREGRDGDAGRRARRGVVDGGRHAAEVEACGRVAPLDIDRLRVRRGAEPLRVGRDDVPGEVPRAVRPVVIRVDERGPEVAGNAGHGPVHSPARLVGEDEGRRLDPVDVRDRRADLGPDRAPAAGVERVRVERRVARG